MKENMKKEIIHIQWKGPFALADVDDLTDEKKDYGLYQIYGNHPVYGAHTLLYLGKTDDQTFATRIKQEKRELFEEDSGMIEVYVGRLSGGKTPQDKEWSEQIDKVERLLIFAHKPAFNGAGVANLSPEAEAKFDLQDLYVFNWGNYASLLPEVSGARWTSRFDKIPDYAPYGSHKR